MQKYILAIDQGTTSSRAILFDEHGHNVASCQQEFTQYFPEPGWVEHDAEEIWQSVLTVIEGVTKQSGITLQQISAIGITNQRETTVIWDKKTGVPVYHAIVWQSRQSLKISDHLRHQGYENKVHKKTGLIINPYFSATKIKWIFDNVKGVKSRAKKGELLFGTIDTWLVWKLTGGKVHVTDYTNASRTMLFNINTLKWDKELLKLFDIPTCILPKVEECCQIYGYAELPFAKNLQIPIAGIAGDQQAALFGQCCFDKGQAKNTYGTGCFLLLNTGTKPVYSQKGLLTTIALGYHGRVTYALEGSVFVGGSVIQFLRDGFKMIANAHESGQMAMDIKTTDGVYFVPAFVGLGTPYWDNEARGAIFGLTRGTKKEHLVRAAVESIAFQSKDVMEVMQEEAQCKLRSFSADGGATADAFLMQFQADIINCKINLPESVETTALGAAYLAGLAVGFYKSKEEIKKNHRIVKTYVPSRTKANVNRIYRGWKKAVEATRTFKM